MNRLGCSIAMLGCAALSACAGQGEFPSLAPRAAERGLAGGSAPAPCLDAQPGQPAQVAQAPARPPGNPQLRQRVSELLQAAQAGDAEFRTVLRAAETAVARAGASGSDAWIEAQQEVSRLAAARSRTADALNELDSLSIGRSAERSVNEEDFRALLQAEEETRALAERQRAELDRVSGRLSAP